jgi:hypothetical protein
MVPLYAARITNLGPGDFVVVECGACGHVGLIRPAALPSLGLGPEERITGSGASAQVPGMRREGTGRRLD